MLEPTLAVARERLRHIAATRFAAVSQPFTLGALTLSVRPSVGLAAYLPT